MERDVLLRLSLKYHQKELALIFTDAQIYKHK